MTLRCKLLRMGLGVATLLGNPIFIQPLKVIAQTQPDIKQLIDALFEQGLQQYSANDFRGAVTSWERSLELYT